MLEFRLRRYGLGARAVDGRFTRSTGVALRRYQRVAASRRTESPARRRTARSPDGARAARPRRRGTSSRPGESFFSIAARYHVSPWRLARRNRLSLMNVIVPNQRSRSREGARLRRPGRRAAGEPRRGALGDRLLVARLRRRPDARPRARVDGVGLPAGRRLERRRDRRHAAPAGDVGVRRRRAARRADAAHYQGNVRAGVRYLRWQLDEFGGDRRLALAGWYQGARAVRERGLYNETKEFVRDPRALRLGLRPPARRARSRRLRRGQVAVHADELGGHTRKVIQRSVGKDVSALLPPGRRSPCRPTLPREAPHARARRPGERRALARGAEAQDEDRSRGARGSAAARAPGARPLDRRGDLAGPRASPPTTSSQCRSEPSATAADVERLALVESPSCECGQQRLALMPRRREVARAELSRLLEEVARSSSSPGNAL